MPNEFDPVLGRRPQAKEGDLKFLLIEMEFVLDPLCRRYDF
jgi:hypothetical protein